MADEPLEYEVRLNSAAVKRLTKSLDTMQGMQEAALIVQREAQRHAPVKTGNLRRSIYHEVERDNRGVVARVGTNVKYGLFQELGTVNHPPHPFLRPAVEALRRRLTFRNR